MKETKKQLPEQDRVKQALQGLGIQLAGRRLDFYSSTEIVDGKEVNVRYVHVVKGDGMSGPVYKVESLLSNL